jgi:hypothetical protein
MWVYFVVPVCATSIAHSILHLLDLTIPELNTFPRAALQTRYICRLIVVREHPRKVGSHSVCQDMPCFYLTRRIITAFRKKKLLFYYILILLNEIHPFINYCSDSFHSRLGVPWFLQLWVLTTKMLPMFLISVVCSAYLGHHIVDLFI